MRYIKLTCVVLILILVCIPALGFRPYCDCSDMDGEWITSRELYENGNPTNQITQENMVLRMNECGAEGTLGESGKIFNSYFAGRAANNLVGRYTLGGNGGTDLGTFTMQLLSGDKDCANFEGWLRSSVGSLSYRWTGQKAPKTPGCSWTGAYEFNQYYEEKIGAQRREDGPSFILQLNQVDGTTVHGKYNDIDVYGTVAYNGNDMEARFNGITPWPEKYPSTANGLIKLYFKNFPNDCNEVEGSWSSGTTMFNSSFSQLSGRRISSGTSGSSSSGPTTGDQTTGDETSIPKDSVPEGSQGGCYADPLTGEVTCIGSNEKPEGYRKGIQGDGSQGLCYEDPETGETVCTGSRGESSNGQGGSQNGCYQDPPTGQYICVS